MAALFFSVGGCPLGRMPPMWGGGKSECCLEEESKDRLLVYDVIGDSTVFDVTWPPGHGRTWCTYCVAAAAWR